MSRLFPSACCISLILLCAGPAQARHDDDHPDAAPPPAVLAAPTTTATLRKYVAAQYPAGAQTMGLGGVVIMRLQVGADGLVHDARIEHGLGDPFDAAALAAAPRLEFHPAREGDRAVPSTITFQYQFEPAAHAASPPGHPGTVTVPTDGSAIQVERVDEVEIVETVEAERPLTAASARTVRERDLKLRPILRPADLFRVTPGLMLVQHAGGGKASQYLLRGFDADHGTDIALSFDGVPLNMVSHGHGQGYADANFIIPELVDRIELSKGPYFVEHGDFANAGTVDLSTRKTAENQVSLGGGSFDTVRAVAIAAPTVGGALHPLLAAEVVHTDGPFVHPENFNKLNLYAKLTYDIGDHSDIALGATSYSGSWNASGQIPTRAVRAGLVDFFGALDDSEGGASSRQNLYLKYRLRPSEQSEFLALAYLTLYDFTLFSNFTFFSRDPINGDQIEQRDDRTVVGSKVSYRWLREWRGVLFDSLVGGEARADSIANGLFYTHRRERLARVVDAEIHESSVAAYAKEEVRPLRWLRLVAGVRADQFDFQVNDRLKDLSTQGNATSGAKGALRISPKATLVLSPHKSTDVFFNFGYGFHSNDARGVVRSVDPVTPLTRTVGYEAGTRVRLLGDRLEAALALWGLDIDSETVWVGDEGTTEAAGATRRVGIDTEARFEIRPWLFADADVTLANARFRENAGNGRAVALAPRMTFSGGLSALHPSGWRGALRALYIAERPATPDEFLKAEATSLLDAFAAYRWRSLELALNIENVLDRHYKSAQFATVTRLANEAPTNAPPPPAACPAGTRAATNPTSGNFIGCEDISFSPGNPINLRLTGTYYF